LKFKIEIGRKAGLKVELETWKWEISAEDGALRAGIHKIYNYDPADSLPTIRRSTQC
jgi:hypothetical protein